MFFFFNNFLLGVCCGNTCYRSISTNALLRNGHELKSLNGRYKLVMQNDGNLVIYCGGSKPIWASHTHGIRIRDGMVLQTDGNLVLYRSDGRAVWSSGTYNKEVDRFVLQDDGNFVGYGKYGQVFYATHTHGKC